MVRMVDVAKEAGVSIKTVSRVLNNEPHVQDAVRARVRAAVERLGYVPSTSARSLRSNRSYTITLLVHDDHSAFASKVQFGALQTCQEAGYFLQLAMLPTEYRGDVEKIDTWLNRILASAKPDGLVLVPPLANENALDEVMKRRSINTVRIGPNSVPESDANATVRINDRKASEELTRHLLSLGHKRIGFIRGVEDQDATEERFQGYAEALRSHGIAVDQSLVLPGTFDFDSGLRGGQHFLALDTPPTAVFAANDDMAAGVIMAALRAGVSVPGDLSVVGFDDSEISVRTWPTLTTVNQPLAKLGQVAVQAIIDAAGSKAGPIQSTDLPYEIIHRDSVAPPKA
ncbi:MAG: LacI family DNA-binding transcriptional regulator [Pseudomonadota bacterium]